MLGTMSLRSSPDAPVAVIGAGPHGLAAAAHLRGAGVPSIVFGRTLEFWRETMPEGMLLRSPLRASSISSPDGALDLNRWAAQAGRELAQNLPVEDFVDYGTWFQQQACSDLDTRRVLGIAPGNGHFTLTLDDGDSLTAGRVVVAAGLAPFARIPAVFAALPESLVSHTSASAPMIDFAGKSVVVIGSGQSALEGAALLLEAGTSEVEPIARARAIYWLNHGWLGVGDPELLPPPAKGGGGPPSWRARHGLYWHGAPTDVGGRFTSWVGAAPDLIHRFPRGVRAPLTYHCIRPAGAHWLPDRLRAAKLTLGREVLEATPEGEQVRLRLDDGSERVVDHVLLGTGYEIDVRRYSFLDAGLGSQLRVKDGYPLLGRGLESSLPGLHFVGAPAAESFGPTMRFVVGTAYTAPALTQYLLGKRRPLFRWAF
jgi:FAD-dependent urate hydroxylase